MPTPPTLPPRVLPPSVLFAKLQGQKPRRILRGPPILLPPPSITLYKTGQQLQPRRHLLATASYSPRSLPPPSITLQDRPTATATSTSSGNGLVFAKKSATVVHHSLQDRPTAKKSATAVRHRQLDGSTSSKVGKSIKKSYS